MNYELFEKIMDADRIETGIHEFKKYLSQYDFGSGKWDEREGLQSGYVLEKLFHLLALSRDLPNYGDASCIIRDMIITVSQQKIVESDWIQKQMEILKLKTYFNEQMISDYY